MEHKQISCPKCGVEMTVATQGPELDVAWLPCPGCGAWVDWDGNVWAPKRREQQ